ncbi:thioesterase II family protein [Pseudoalteromonas rhizosphaerae]|uniref:thioesterase II family protein n=1 Tax=Pseudoalteromonas rhizosphaerae TaxID=2518973 RepID=UPI0021476DD2|nr:alpha/beta fold hydrolase [Pseudoalteromonas rhizosphaerae]
MLDKQYYFTPEPLMNPRARIFCFPYAGGTSSIYYNWAKYFLPHNIEVVAINLPGRGARFADPFDVSIEDAVTKVLSEFDDLFNRPFYLYGHSNGGLYAYELASQLAKAGRLHNCKHLFIGAKAAPRKRYCREPLHLLSDSAFRQALRDLGGTPEALLADQQLLDLLSPMLRSDFRLGHEYMHTEPEHCLSALPATLIYGTGDKDVGSKEVSGWQELLPAAQLHAIEGEHFFIHHQQAELIDSLLNKMSAKTQGIER